MSPPLCCASVPRREEPPLGERGLGILPLVLGTSDGSKGDPGLAVRSASLSVEEEWRKDFIEEETRDSTCPSKGKWGLP
jgi:hypothetical protein